MRVWRKSWRDVDIVRVELEFLDYLRERNFPASTPLRTREGELYFKVDSPEGSRARRDVHLGAGAQVRRGA